MFCFSYHLIDALGLLNNFSPIIRECLKVGSGVTCCTGTSRTNGWVVEVVMIISESSEQTSLSCLRACGSKTEVFEAMISGSTSCYQINSGTA